MLIPLETNHKRIVVNVSISVTRPVKLGIIIYDPSRSHTHYIRRKVPFYYELHRDISLPLPFTPFRALMEIHNKETPSDPDYGFTVDRVSMEPLPYNDVWATPERHRYMSFAIDFAKKAGYIQPGFYPSDGYEFLIHYVPKIVDENGRDLVTPARIQREMPRVQVSQKLFKQFSIPVRIAIMAHEGCHYFLNTRSEKVADFCGLRYYLDSGFPSIEAVYAATQVFLSHPETVGQGHMVRTQAIDEFIENYKKLKQSS